MTAANVFIAYIGPSSGCSTAASSPACGTGESIPFGARSFGYNYGCANHSFSWNYGDGTNGSGQDAPHSYSAAGTYNVSVTISNGGQTFTATQAVRVGGGGDPPIGNCPTMTAGSNVFMGYVGSQSGCTAGSGDCKAAENINFTASSFGYNYDCAAHSFLWNFGDGGTSTDKNPTHAYAAGGDYTVSLKITNPSQNVTHTRTIKVTGSNNCPNMVANQNVILQYFGVKSSCTSSNGRPCQEDEDVLFGANALGYNFGCSAHQFLWTFGDGTTSSEQNPTHLYDKKGTFQGSLKVTNSKQQLTIPFSITISSGSSRRRSAPH